jgi:uncharacterized protein YjbJ (UPF0337 family)
MKDLKNHAPAVQGNWAEQSTKLKAKFSNLTDADLRFADGKKEEMMTKLHTKLGKTKEQLAAIIAAL